MKWPSLQKWADSA